MKKAGTKMLIVESLQREMCALDTFPHSQTFIEPVVYKKRKTRKCHFNKF